MKPYVICHMMPSVDGRLRADRWDVPEAGHKEYERTADTYHADAWVCGRKTMEEFAKDPQFVARAVELVQTAGREVATPAYVRERLGTK